MYLLGKKKFILFLQSKQGFPLILGVIIGLTMNLVTLPMWEHTCTAALGQFGGIYPGNDLQHSSYEPRLVKRDPDEIAHKMVAAKQVVRPRYYSSELSIKSKLVVAIVTKLSVVKQYGLTWNLTIHEHVDHLVFFIGEELPRTLSGLPIISFSGVEKGHLLMNSVLSYLHKHYSESYEFFLLTSAMNPSSVPYINSLALRRALVSVSTSRPVHHGVPAAKGAHYCKLGDGIVLSSSVVSSVAAASAWCRTHASLSASDDANLGRCVMHATALPCSVRVQEKLYRSIGLTAPQQGRSVLHELSATVGQRGLSTPPPVAPYTVTGLSQPHHLLAVHQYFLTGEVMIAKSALAATRDVIMRTRRKAPLRPFEVTWPLGSHPRSRPPTRYDVVPWITFNASHVFMPDEHRNSAPLSGALLEDVTSVVLAGSSHVTNVSSGRMLLQRLEYGHYRVDPVRGTDYILSLTFRDGASGALVTKVVEASRGIVNTEFVPMPFVNENTKLTLVVPVSVALVEQALGFIERFTKNKGVWPNCSVLLVLLLPPSADKKTNIFKSVTSAASDSDGLVRTASVLTSADTSHMAELTLMDQVVRKVGSDSLVFVVPPSSTFSNEVLNRVRMNTIQGWQFFSPVMYGLYHPSVVEDSASAAYVNREIKSTLGHYLRYDFSAISFYMSDYVTARKLSSKLFPIFGSSRTRSDHATQQRRKHSISLYRLLVSYSSCHALRAPEPFLRMPYEETACCSSHVYDASQNRDTNVKPLSSESNSVRKLSTGRKNERGKSDLFSDINVAPRLPVNRLLSDVSLLLGDSREDNNAAFYHYVTGNLLSQLQPPFHNNTLNDFLGDSFCYEKCLDSFGTRVQLSKLLMEYDDKYGSLSN